MVARSPRRHPNSELRDPNSEAQSFLAGVGVRLGDAADRGTVYVEIDEGWWEFEAWPVALEPDGGVRLSPVGNQDGSTIVLLDFTRLGGIQTDATSSGEERNHGQNHAISAAR